MVEKFNKYLNDGYLMKQVHPTKDLTIWNYTRKAQYEDYWDDITLMCRGLVTNSKGEIVSRCFPKFFNWEQLKSINYNIPNEPFTITDKMDGQYIGLFYYDNEWIINSRASFASIYSDNPACLKFSSAVLCRPSSSSIVISLPPVFARAQAI